MALERYGHGGDLWTAAETFGGDKGRFLDYSSNMNPFGPPPSVGSVLSERWRDLAAYPDPAVRELRAKLAAHYGVPAESILVGNGAAELIDLLVRVLQPAATALAQPSFVEYEGAVRHAGGRVHSMPLLAEHGFTLQRETLETALAASDLVFLGQPNNPSGTLVPQELLQLAADSGTPLALDEAFLDFSPEEDRLTWMRRAAERQGLFVVRSMTKFYAIPGVRLGFLVAHPDHIRELKERQVPWSVNAFAQWIGCAVLDEREYAERTRSWLLAERPWLEARLAELGLSVVPNAAANFLLFALPHGFEGRVRGLQRYLGERGILVRDASRFAGLDESWCRVAVKLRADNERLIASLAEALAALQTESNAAAKGGRFPMNRKSSLPLGRTIMVQGTSSDVGKSILTAALCRIFTQDGYRVRPFKSQNMSLNSYVTPDGKEIGRAQGVQADACGVPATTDMNPILLKPKGDMTSQVVVHGKPYADLDARAYRESYLPQAESIVKEALERLRAAADIVVLEGAGSPAEVNLKDRDIVNMRAAAWAEAPVLLAADIDRGGVFASIVGTLEILTSEERDRVAGFIINKFRGDVSLLRPGLDWLEERTGKPVLGVVPYLHELDIEDEDSASLDAKRRVTYESQLSKQGDVLDIAVIRLPHISNFTDVDPLLQEPDVRVRFVGSPAEWGDPDAVIVPGSKNTIEDLLYIREKELDALIIHHIKHRNRWVTGICAGYQMLGSRLLDPEGYESDRAAELDGLGLLPTATRFTKDKRTEQVRGYAALFGHPPLPVEGYEIHMGRTVYLEPVEAPFSIAEAGEPPHGDGASAYGGKVWGTYVHGILHNDELRRAWLNAMRAEKGWAPLAAELRFRERRERAFDRLAVHVREHLDMDRIYAMIGLGND